MRRAFTLLEVLFSASFLAFFFFAIISLYPSTIFSVKQSEHRLAANALAQEMLDQCSAGPYSSLVAGTWTAAAPGRLTFIADRKLADQTVLRPVVTVAEGPTPNTRARVREVTATVNWLERNRPQTLVRFRSIANVRR